MIKGFKNKGLEVEEDFLEVGDILLDDGYAIERKDKDLIPSIISNRLYDQLNNLCNFKHPILCIVMENLWKTFYFSNSRWVHKAYSGMLTTLSVSYPNLKVMQFSDENEYIDYVASLDKKIHKEGTSERPQPIHRKGKSMNMKVEDCLTSASGISISLSKRFLREYGTISNLCQASVEDLMNIEGIGSKKAQSIVELLHHRWKDKVKKK